MDHLQAANCDFRNSVKCLLKRVFVLLMTFLSYSVFSVASHAGSLTVTVVDKQGKAVSDVVVYLEGSAINNKHRPGNLEVSQKDKKFFPLVSVMQTGGSVLFPNNDTVQHHVYSFSPIKRFELKLYAGTPSSPVVFDKAGTVTLGCNIHDSMLAYIHVVDTPVFGKTDAQGRVQFKDLSNADYLVKTWHFQTPNDLATKPETVQLKDDIKMTINLPYKAKEWVAPKSDSPYY